ncbi:MAG: cytochrome c maturation protein CcmE [bacterium]
MNKKRLKIAFSFAVVIGVLSWLLISGFDGNMQYYIKIKEVMAMGAKAETTGLRVKGKLVSGSLQKIDEKKLEYSFAIADEDQEMKVHYHGILPDTFKDGAEVIVEGKLSPQGYFAAQTVLAKCPSKYESSAEYGDVDSYQNNTGDAPEGTN